GDHAMAVYAVAEALLHFDQALALVTASCPATEEQLLHLFGRRGRALELESRFEDADDNYLMMEKFALDRSQARLELAAVLAQTKLRSFTNLLFDPVEGKKLAERSLALAETLDDRRSQAEIYWDLMNQARFNTGQQEEAIAAGEHALEIARAIGWQEQVAAILNDISDVYADSGRFVKGEAALAEARTLWKEFGNQPMLADNLSNTGVWRIMQGDFQGAMDCFDEALDITTRIKNVWGQSYSRSVRGIASWQLGRYDQTIEDFTVGPALADEAGFLIGQVLPRIQLAFVYLELGCPHLGLALLQGLSDSMGTPIPQFTPSLPVVLAAFQEINGLTEAAAGFSGSPDDVDPMQGFWVFNFASLSWFVRLLHAGRLEEAVAMCNRHIDVMQAHDIVAFQTDARLFAGRALVQLGRITEAREQLSTARAQALSIGQRRILWQVLPPLADLTPDASTADALRAEAAEMMANIRDRLPTEELRAGFLALPDVRRTLD
ncbi:MAG: tetratricopeptide repeat protein, partial [Caldilineales bacterium]